MILRRTNQEFEVFKKTWHNSTVVGDETSAVAGPATRRFYPRFIAADADTPTGSPQDNTMSSRLVFLSLYGESVFDAVRQVCLRFTLTLRFGTGFYSQSPLSWCARSQSRSSCAYTVALVKILVGVLRYYVVILLQSPPKKLPRAAIREQCVFALTCTPRGAEETCKASARAL